MKKGSEGIEGVWMIFLFPIAIVLLFVMVIVGALAGEYNEEWW